MTILLANPSPPPPEPPARAFNAEVAAAAGYLAATRGERLAMQLKTWAKLGPGWDGPGSLPMDREACIAMAAIIIACPLEWTDDWSLVPWPDGVLSAKLAFADERGHLSIEAHRRHGDIAFSLSVNDGPRSWHHYVSMLTDAIKAAFAPG